MHRFNADIKVVSAVCIHQIPCIDQNDAICLIIIKIRSDHPSTLIINIKAKRELVIDRLCHFWLFPACKFSQARSESANACQIRDQLVETNRKRYNMSIFEKVSFLTCSEGSKIHENCISRTDHYFFKRFFALDSSRRDLSGNIWSYGPISLSSWDRRGSVFFRGGQ